MSTPRFLLLARDGPPTLGVPFHSVILSSPYLLYKNNLELTSPSPIYSISMITDVQGFPIGHLNTSYFGSTLLLLDLNFINFRFFLFYDIYYYCYYYKTPMVKHLRLIKRFIRFSVVYLISNYDYNLLSIFFVCSVISFNQLF